MQLIDLGSEHALSDERMLTGRQIRGARAMLGWSARELADRAGLSLSAIQRAEVSNDIPNMRAPNLNQVQRALEDGGITFFAAGETPRPGGVGMRLRIRLTRPS
jgi:hypothetical protein